jgi:hypothetical protein
MSASKQEWLKGSLAGWLATVFLAANCFFIKRYVEAADRDRVMLYSHETRISVLEARKMAMGGTNSSVMFGDAFGPREQAQ